MNKTFETIEAKLFWCAARELRAAIAADAPADEIETLREEIRGFKRNTDNAVIRERCIALLAPRPTREVSIA